MEAKSTTVMGRSLVVPSVQELAKQSLTTVPPQYVRDEEENPITCNVNSSPDVLLPVIDMQKLLLSGDPMDSDNYSELDKLNNACKDWGFFLLKNHGVSNSLVEKVKVEIQEFFNLPMEEKKKYWQQPGDFEGFGQAFVVSEDQKLDWVEGFNMFTLPIHMRKPHLFPKLPPSLRDTLEAYSTELKNLSLEMLNQIAKVVKIDPNEVKELFEEGMQTMRMNYYPPCPQPDRVIGLNPHSDASALTILLQLTATDGLQIKKDGMWVAIKPLPDTFIINVGDALELFTNGIYRSIEHGATVNSSNERLSIATFYSPKLNGEISPAPSIVKPETPPLFRKISVVDYVKGFLSRKLHGKSNVELLRILNDDNKSC